ncbi:hypothetical protein Lgee_0579 [Legionella geestiana]|uniref:Uncharacterized protein n=1 Tax=Legionella geestiana TaxID=45065 RepID=A0A0W0U6E2_9GAMM|nr:hypothetical protein [Legionella geestiana]KTD03081.1 hypothetical protein Lgee_0579 [Legionella geestiana]QBS12977.1 hypothetical protein E4T54_09630 [Legionella geestiana]STX54516.1 Uncharacterised protein [Legionella geestiana]
MKMHRCRASVRKTNYGNLAFGIAGAVMKVERFIWAALNTHARMIFLRRVQLLMDKRVDA